MGQRVPGMGREAILTHQEPAGLDTGMTRDGRQSALMLHLLSEIILWWSMCLCVHMQVYMCKCGWGGQRLTSSAVS